MLYSRRRTITVNIGNIPMGSDYPVRIQSMGNTQTRDIDSSVEQCIRIIKADADYVRFTVPSLSDVKAFAAIKSRIREKNYSAPLIADVHFNPEIALKVAEYADKVRVNPGNFIDKSRFTELIRICREQGVAIRIGVNHGSLSEKIMDRYGDTPAGMVESAMEFLRICRDENFDQVVVSMKASNVRVMVYATRLIAHIMDREGLNYPLHLGVTEAGAGEDGRIKSAAGTGTLLAGGLGDTIRVSLTEEPEAEIPVAARIANLFSGKEVYSRGRFEFVKRKTRPTGNIGGNQVPVVPGFDKLDIGIRLIEGDWDNMNDQFIQELSSDTKAVLVYKAESENIPAELSALREKLEGCEVPVIIKLNLKETSAEDFMLKSAAFLGGAFIDGFGDGIWLTNSFPLEKDFINSVSLGILQACRTRMSKTEYISCPSCGRTQFNLMQTVARIKQATSHLKGLKIGVMGCIVNGPGEMADADYGYVGAGKGKITLYKAREVVKKGVPEGQAVDELIALIKENGDWIDMDS